MGYKEQLEYEHRLERNARIAGLKEALELCDTYFHGTDCRAAITFRISQLEQASNV